MPTPGMPSPNPEPSSTAIHRLYALWVVGFLLLVLLMIVLALLSSGRLRHHELAISDQADAIEQLRAELSRTREDLARLQDATTAPAPPPEELPETAVEPTQDATPAPAESPGLQPTARGPQPAAPGPSADDPIAALLAAALAPGGETGPELADAVAADRALREGLGHTRNETWSGDTWARLALVARLLDRDGPAEAFASKAIAANVFPREYYEASARRMLADGRAARAIVFAGRLRAAEPGNPQAALLLGEAHGLLDDLAAADLAVVALDGGEQLATDDKLRLGRLLVELERWDRLETLLATLRPTEQADPTQLMQLNFLHAVLAVRQGRLPEALAILDNLLAEHPGDYDFQTWRGVALLEARQFQAAREALAVADAQPDRPQAWYWLGILEVRAGNPDQAISFFQKGLAASQRYAPLWEAMGTVALNGGDLPHAIQNLENAVAANPRRASSHFLLAIVHAKMLRPTAAGEALRAALVLDPNLLEQARQTEVIRRLFTDEELDALAGGSDDPAAPAGHQAETE